MKIKEIFQTIKLTKKQSDMEKDLMQALAYVRNNVILGRGKNTSAESLMQELADITTSIKPAFIEMGQYLHVCDKEKAEDVLYEYLGTGFSKDLGRMLAGWEDIPPEDLQGTIEIYLDNLREQNLEKKKRDDEIISDLIYFPVVMNAMFVLLDFVYVAFFIEQQKLFEQMF